jgi:hypothetical protein
LIKTIQVQLLMLLATSYWLSTIISSWAEELKKSELDKRKRGSNPPVSEKPISDKEVEDFRKQSSILPNS